jgi:DedD protein
MDKEKKKLLLVAVSVGVFLAIAISVAVLLLMPKASEGPAYSSYPIISAGQQPASVDSYDLVRNNENILGLLPAPNATASQETNFYINGEPYASLYMETQNSDNNSQVTINIPRPSAAAVPDATPANPQRPAQTPAATTQSPAPVATAPATTAPAAQTPQRSPTTNASSSASASPQRTTTTPASAAVTQSAPVRSRIDYWIQTGSFTAKIRAESARETLASKGIVSLIENRDIEGTTWYRVRIGPYTTEAEANYWLALVQKLEGFSGSQVWQTPSYR